MNATMLLCTQILCMHRLLANTHYTSSLFVCAVFALLLHVLHKLLVNAHYIIQNYFLSFTIRAMSALLLQRLHKLRILIIHFHNGNFFKIGKHIDTGKI